MVSADARIQTVLEKVKLIQTSLKYYEYIDKMNR